MMNFKPNSIIHGDCLNWLPHIPSNSIDMCYIDPPFFTQRDFGEFNDKWKGGMDQYIDFISQRVKEIHRVLKDTGSIFLHCDYHANYRLRFMLDKIFGEKNFVNEIIWKRVRIPNFQSLNFPCQKDTIFLYKKNNFKLKKSYVPSSSKRSKEGFIRTDKKGVFSIASIQTAGPIMKNKKFMFKNRIAPYIYTLENLKKLEKENLLFQTKSGRFYKKAYLKDYKGVVVSDLWIEKEVSPNLAIHEKPNYLKTKYPTQKPELLLKRIIECSTDKGDLVLDCFGGSGTTAAVAMKLRRKFITGDVSKEACEIMESRLVKIGPFHVVKSEDLNQVDLSKVKPNKINKEDIERMKKYSEIKNLSHKIKLKEETNERSN